MNSHQENLLHFTVYGTFKAIDVIDKPEQFIYYTNPAVPSARAAYEQARTNLYTQGREVQVKKITWKSTYTGKTIVIKPDTYLEN